MLVRNEVEGFRIRSEWFGIDFANYLCTRIGIDGFMVVSPSPPYGGSVKRPNSTKKFNLTLNCQADLKILRGNEYRVVQANH